MSKSDFVELEAKLLVEDLDVIATRMVAAGAVPVSQRVFEANIRYENPQHTFTRDGIVLRLRQDARVRLTYKEPLEQTEADLMKRFEAEVEVSDFAAMTVILEKLGFVPFARYEKYRTTYDLGDVELVLDELPFGNFVELEGSAGAIREQIDRLSLANYPRFHESYLALFENVKANLDLAFDDLTFENFEGIEVPVSAFFSSATS